jgi:hypothetical protein
VLAHDEGILDICSTCFRWSIVERWRRKTTLSVGKKVLILQDSDDLAVEYTLHGFTRSTRE